MVNQQEKECLKVAKTSAVQFDKFAHLSSSYGVKLSLEWSKCPDTGKQQGKFNFFNVLMLSERFVATMRTYNESRMCTFTVIDKLNSMIQKQIRMMNSVKEALMSSETINTSGWTSDEDSMTGVVEEEDRAVYLIDVWKLVKCRGHSLYALAASKSLAIVTDQIMAKLRKQLEYDYLFLISFRNDVKALRRVDIKFIDFEMLQAKMNVKRQRLGHLVVDIINSQREFTGNR